MARSGQSGHRSAIVIADRQRAVRVAPERLRRLIRFVAGQEGHRLAHVDVTIVDADAIADLNQGFLRHAGPTDVLSFDLSDANAPGISAQIVVCGSVAKAQAAARGLPARRELMLYVVHGLLHLMGYEDHTVRGRARMNARQDELLDAFLAAGR